MERIMGIAILGELLFINLVYAYKEVRALHFLPYLWLIAVFTVGGVIVDFVPAKYVLIIAGATAISHVIAVYAPLSRR